MNLILILIQRYASKSPKLFRIITWAAVLTIVIAKALLVIEARIDLKWIDEGFIGLLNDAMFLAIGIAIPSGLTTDNKGIQSETDKLLK